MTNKTVPLSVRISDEDATFLAQLTIADAKTPSEKLRAIVARERRREEGTQDPDAAIDLVQDMLRPAQRRLRRQETDVAGDGRRSDLVHKAYDRVPELAGLLMAGPTGGQNAKGDSRSQNSKNLAEFEARIASQMAALARDFMELGLSSRDRCYTDGVVTKHLPAVIELADLLKLSLDSRKETK